MARPIKKGLDYFPHDTDAHNDQKLQSLMALYGCDGYAFYFILLEIIFRMENGWITCGKPEERAGLSRSIGISVEKFDNILIAALNIGCFDKELYDKEKILISNGIKKRILEINNLRQKDRERKVNKERDLSNKDKEKGKAKTGKPMENSLKTQEPLNAVVSDSQFISLLKNNPAYMGKINIDTELCKMDAWLLTSKGKGRKKTRRFIVNWLNKIDTEVQTSEQNKKKLNIV